jgi:hypothetical protein
MTPHDSTRCACGKGVDEVLEYITGLDGEPERTAVMLSLRELRLLREQVATLTAERDAWEVACHNATIEKHEALARATPAEGARECDGCWDTESPRTKYAITGHKAHATIADYCDKCAREDEMSGLTLTPLAIQSTPPRSPATVTEVTPAMVERAALAIFEEGGGGNFYALLGEEQDRMVDYARRVLTAALTGGRDAE